jgi:hypothetical protein
MARNTINRLSQWFSDLVSFSGRANPTPSGGLELVQTNEIEDFSFAQLVASPGGTESVSLQIDQAQELEEFVVYSSKASGGRKGLGRQESIPAGRDFWMGDQPIIIGPRPRLSAGPSEQQQPAPDFELKAVSVPAGRIGFAGGTRLGAVSIISAGGAHTTLSDPVEFTHANGVDIEVTLPDEMSEGGRRWGVWVSEEVSSGSPDPSTLSLQDTATKRQRTVLLRRYRKGRKPPTSNETFIGRAHTPRIGYDVNRKPAPGDLYPMEDFSICITEVTPRGESKASERTPERTVAPRIRVVEHRRPLGEDEQPAEGEAYLITESGKRYAIVRKKLILPWPNTAYWVNPTRHHPDSSRYKVYVRLNGVWGQIVNTNAVSPGLGRKFGEATPVYGRKEDAGSEATVGAASSSSEGGEQWVWRQADPPLSEDLSGIEAPSGEIDPPVGKGSSRPPVGTYTLTYAPRIGGEEQRAASPKRVTIASDEMPMLIFPRFVNRIPNAGGEERGADGLPLNWTFDLGSPAVGRAALAPGKVGVATLATITDTSVVRPFVDSDPVEASSEVETIRGVLEVPDYISGEGRVVLIQENASGAQLATTALAQLPAQGAIPFAKTIGPSGSTADIKLNALTKSLRVRVSAHFGSATSKNLSARVYDLALHPFEGEPRKLIFPAAGTVALPAPGLPETPYLEGPVATLALPPASAVVVPTRRAIERLSFPAGSPVVPANFSRVRSPNNANVIAEVSEDGAINGPLGMHFASRATNAVTQAYFDRTYSTSLASGTRLAVFSYVIFDELPSSGWVTFLVIGNAADNRWMTFGRVNQWGRIQLGTVGAGGVFRFADGPFVGPGSLLAIELHAWGVNTKDGQAALFAGVNGAPRRLVANFDNTDWRGYSARRVVLGAIQETDSSGTWDFRMDDVAVTLSGDTWGDTASATQGIDTPTPDRPIRVRSALASGTGNLSAASAPLAGSVSAWLKIAGTVGSLGVTFGSIGQDTSTPIATARSNSAGKVILDYPGGSQTTGLTLEASDEVILEIGVEGAATPEGNVYLYYRASSSPAQERRLIGFVGGADLSAYTATNFLKVIAASFTGTPSWTASATGEAIYSEIDDKGEQNAQFYVFVPPGYENQGIGGKLLERVVVPGQTYTLAITGRRDFQTSEATEDGWQVYLENDAGERITAGQLASVEDSWGEWELIFTPPQGFTRLWAEFYPKGAGLWVFQEPLLGRGALATQAQRDAARSHAREAGTFSVILPSGVPSKRDRTEFYERRTSLEARFDVPIGATLSSTWSFGPTQEGPWSAASDPDEILGLLEEDAAFVKVDGEMEPTLDTFEGPVAAPASIASEYVTELPILLKEDGTSYPGGSRVTDLSWPYSRPDYRTDSVGGHARPVPTTEDIDRIDGFTVIFFTAEGAQEFASDMLREDKTLDYPASGLTMRVRLYEVAERDIPDFDLLEEQIGHVWTAFSVDLCEVMERGVLDQRIRITEEKPPVLGITWDDTRTFETLGTLTFEEASQ